MSKLEVDAIEPQSGTTLTLGASGDTVALGSGAILGSGMGKVLQVVNATFSTSVITTTSSFTDVGLSASITPSSTSNKVLIFVNVNGLFKTDTDTGISLRLLRGVTNIHNIESSALYTASTSTISVGSSSTSYLDTPSTTSSTTYKIQFNSFSNSSYVGVNSGSGTVSTMTLMEIQA